MKRYKIDICEYYGKTVEIKAETEEEAFKKYAEDEETNRFNNIKYYLNEIKRNVKESSLLIQDENYSQMAENFISFIKTLLCNPEFCFIETKFPRIEKACTEILVAAWDASERAGLSKFPLYDPYFYDFLYLCRNKSSGYNLADKPLCIKKEDVNHHVNKALNKLMCRIIKTVMNYQN